MWDTEMPLILRHIIDDIDDPVKYNDLRLQQLLLASAQLIQSDHPFQNYYSTNIETVTISPDPTVSPRDDPFINLTILKAACLLSGSKLLKSSFQAMYVREASYSFDSRGVFSGQQFTAKTWCDAYNEAKWQYISSNMVPGEAIIGPYRTFINRFPVQCSYPNNRIYR